MDASRDTDRAAGLLALVRRTPPADVTVLLQAGAELRELRERLNAAEIRFWTGDADEGVQLAAEKLAQVRGRHYLDWLGTLNAWRSQRTEKADTEALQLLSEIFDAVEREGQLQHWTLAPDYYRRAAIIYARRGQYAEEVAVCQRYEDASPPGTGGALRERLELARARLAQS